MGLRRLRSPMALLHLTPPEPSGFLFCLFPRPAGFKVLGKALGKVLGFFLAYLTVLNQRFTRT